MHGENFHRPLQARAKKFDELLSARRQAQDPREISDPDFPCAGCVDLGRIKD